MRPCPWAASPGHDWRGCPSDPCAGRRKIVAGRVRHIRDRLARTQPEISRLFRELEQEIAEMIGRN